MELETISPKEAADNLNEAQALDVDPIVYPQYKSQLKPDLEALKQSEPTPQVKSYMSRSPSNASLAQPDTDKLSTMERYFYSIKDAIGIRNTTQQKLAEINLRKMFKPESITEDDELEIFKLNEDFKRLPNYGLEGFWENLPAGVAGVVTDTVKGFERNKELIGGSTAIGAAYGFGSSLLTGPFAIATAGPATFTGASVGLGRGIVASMAIDGANRQMGLTFNDLSNMTDENGQPLNIDHDTKMYLSASVGIVSGILDGIVGFGMGVNAGIKTAGKQSLAKAAMSEAGKKTIRPALIALGKSMLEGGSAEALDETIQVLAEELAKTYTDEKGIEFSDARFGNALWASKERIAAAGVTGAVATTTMTGALSFGVNMVDRSRKFGPGDLIVKSDIKQDSELNVFERAKRALVLEDHISAITDISKSTEMSKLSPSELSGLRQQMSVESGVQTVYMDTEDLRAFAQNEEKAAAIRAAGILDETGTAVAQMNAPSAFPLHKFLDLVDKYPELKELAKLRPEDPTAQQARDFLTKFNEAESQRIEVLKKLQVPDITPEEKAKLEAQLEKEDPSRIYPSNEVFGEEQYLNQPTFTEAIESVTGKGVAKKYNDAQLKARQSVVDGIMDTANAEMQEIVDITTQEAIDAELEAQFQRLENNPNLAIVDRFTQPKDFTPTSRYSSFEEMTANHAKKGYSPWAIDPRTLTEVQREKFLNNPQLKKHKVFVKGGISADYANTWFGTGSVDNLLNILSQTPSREEIANARANARKADIEANARESVNLNETALIQAYNDNTANHIEEMKFMREQKWTDTKFGIKKIALPLPRISELVYKAKSFIDKTAVKDLNVNQFKVGERKSQRIAIDSILKNEVEKAFVNKENAAMNSELAKHTHLAIGKVNRVFKLARRFEKPNVIQELKDAGPSYVKAANEILDVFKLSKKREGTSEAEAFRKFLEKRLAEGEPVVEIPERLSDVRKSAMDMPVEQVLAVGDALSNILHLAKMKNKLYTKFEKIKQLQTIEALSVGVNQHLSSHPDYKPSRVNSLQDSSLTHTERLAKGLLSTKSYLERSQHIILKLDQDNVNGLMNEIIYQPIKNAANKAADLSIQIRDRMQVIIDAFGKDEFSKLNQDIVVVPEFSAVKSFREGKVSKGQLLKMLLNTGNDGNLEALERFGVTREVMMQVFEKHLDERHMKFAQQVWDIFKSFEPDIKALQEKTEAKEVRFVEAKPLVFKGREYPGGYFPIQYHIDGSRKTAKRLAGAAELANFERFQQNFYSEAMTEQGHLKARTGSSEVVDLSLNKIGSALSNVVIDLSMRIPVRDTAKLLSTESIRNDIVSVVGVEGYNNIADMVIDSAEADNEVSAADGMMLNLFNHVSAGFQTVALVGKVTSIAIQPASIFYAADKMGDGGAAYIGKAAKKIGLNPKSWPDMYAFASEIHPSIKQSREDMESDLSHAIAKILPKKHTGSKKFDAVIAGRDLVNELGFAALGGMDAVNKVLVVSAAYMQAMDGKAKGVPGGIHAEAAKYASNIAELTQTHSATRNLAPIQKNKWLKWMTFFYNDANNVYNSVLAAGRKANQSFKDTGNLVRQKDYKRASKAAAQGVAGMMGFMLTMTAAKTYENIIRGLPTPFTDDEDEDQSIVEKSAYYFLDSSRDIAIGSLPIFRDINYSIDFQNKFGKKKAVSQPYLSMMENVKEATTGISELLDFTSGKTLTQAQIKGMVHTLGYITKTPTDSIYRYLLQPNYEDATSTNKGYLKQIGEKIDKIKKSVSSAVEAGETPPIPPELLEQMEQLQREINPVNPADLGADIPADTLEVIRQIESGGRWDAQNPNSSAAGLYQFTEGTWNDLMTRHPELGLTENGRVSQNTEQQERAMEQFTRDNIAVLERNGLELSTENIYAAHFLGAEGAVNVLTAENPSRLRNVVSAEVMSANNFPRNMTIRQFKRWVESKVQALGML